MKAITVLLWMWAWSALPAGAAASPSARLEATTLPATGRQETLLHVERYGRFAVTAASDQGVALQWIDRMTGPGPVRGPPSRRFSRWETSSGPTGRPAWSRRWAATPR